MLKELRNQRIALSIEVDRARRWRNTAALDQIKKSLEARLVALDKEIKEVTEGTGTGKAATNETSTLTVQAN
jgi:hypothetical protein